MSEAAPVEAKAPSAAPVSQRPIDELALRRQQRRTRLLSVLVAAVMAAALASVASFTGWSTRDKRR